MMQSSPTRNQESQVVPLRRQYLQLKVRFPDTILLFRLGDFYETFDEDAELAAKLLDIVLTGRDMGKGKRVPMAGIPHHAAEGYIARLVSAGHKVAVCEQIGSPQKGRGLVERDVTRVVTPGTVLDPAMLDAQSNSFIASVFIERNRAGLAFADITTGEFKCTEFERPSIVELAQAIERELVRLEPREIVVPPTEGSSKSGSIPAWLPQGSATSHLEQWKWRIDRASDALQRHFGVQSLDGFGCAGASLATMAAGGLIQYLGETQVSGISQISSLNSYSVEEFMTLDFQTRRNLELMESTRGDRRNSLISVLDLTRTPMGARLLRQWVNQPLLNVQQIRDRLDWVEWFYANRLAREELRQTISKISDVERLTNRVIAGIAKPKDLANLRSSLAMFPEVNRILQESQLSIQLAHPAELQALLEQGLRPNLTRTERRQQRRVSGSPAWNDMSVKERDCERSRSDITRFLGITSKYQRQHWRRRSAIGRRPV
jgi:DNA mismatch repair protein MutS